MISCFFVYKDKDDKVEYQCVTIENLIDTEYFSNDILESNVSKDRKVKASDMFI